MSKFLELLTAAILGAVVAILLTLYTDKGLPFFFDGVLHHLKLGIYP